MNAKLFTIMSSDLLGYFFFLRSLHMTDKDREDDFMIYVIIFISTMTSLIVLLR